MIMIERTVIRQQNLTEIPANVAAIGGAGGVSEIFMARFGMLDHILQSGDVRGRVFQRVWSA